MSKIYIGGFALRASLSTSTDDSSSNPTISAFYAVPNPVSANTQVTFLWETVACPKVRITGPNGYDSGLMLSGGSSGITIPSGFSLLGSGIYTIKAYDATGAPLMLGPSQIAATLNLTVH